MALFDEYMVGVDGAWSDREAAHLWRRAGFGARPDERAAAVGGGDQNAFRVAVDSLVTYQAQDPNLDATSGGGFWGGPIAGLPDDEETDEGRTKNPNELDWLQAHFFYRMMFTSQPFQEQFTLFLHDHFVSGFDKVRGEFDGFQRSEIDTRAATCDLLRDQLSQFREMGMDGLRELLIDITRNPAMLLYLDNYNNGAGEGRAQENYAREIMELFSMGVDNYSEEDVREIARAFTGEALPNVRDPGAPDAFDYGYRTGNHESGTKSVFGQTITEDMTGQETVDVIDLILSRQGASPNVSGLQAPYNDLPATAVYMAWKLLRWFVNHNVQLNPPDPAVLELADFMRGSDNAEYPARRFPYDMRACMGKIFLSKFFYDSNNFFSVIKTPADHTVMSLRLMQLPYDRGDGYYSPRHRMSNMGMELFEAPNVAGWSHGRPWINAGYMVERYNWIDIVAQRIMDDSDIDDMQIINGGFLDPDEDAAIIDYFRDVLIQDDLELWAPGATAMLMNFLADVTEEHGNQDRRFREKVRGTIYLMMTMPIWQMK